MSPTARAPREALALSTRATLAEISEVKARAEALGLRVTGHCRHCGGALWAARSIQIGAGPVCRARHEKTPAAVPTKERHGEGDTNTTQATKEGNN